MFDFAPLFADMEDLIKLGLFVLFFVLPALGKLFQEASKKNAAPRREAMPPRRDGDLEDMRADVAPGPGQAKPQAAGRDALEAEIEDFLRRASGQAAKPEQRPPAEAPARAATPRQPTSRPSAVPPAETGRGTQRPTTQRPPARRGSATQRTGQPARTQPVQGFDQLAQDLSQADERVEAHLQEVFDHDLGQLAKTTTDRAGDEVILEGTDAATWESTADRDRRRSAAIRDRSARVIEMLRDPDHVRDAIIIGEILNPPKTLR
ncbi:MAG: hypothetical protein AAGF97_10795 [Planctomycetota bacterium]